MWHVQTKMIISLVEWSQDLYGLSNMDYTELFPSRNPPSAVFWVHKSFSWFCFVKPTLYVDSRLQRPNLPSQVCIAISSFFCVVIDWFHCGVSTFFFLARRSNLVLVDSQDKILWETPVIYLYHLSSHSMMHNWKWWKPKY